MKPKPFHPRRTLFVGSLLILLVLYTYTRHPKGPEQVHWTGQTMGTTYSVKLARSPLSIHALRELHARMNRYLIEINEQMSTYIPDSEISRFNRSTDTAPIPVSPSFAEVTRQALHWAEQTGGAFDPTLDPLINLWGFGHEGEPDSVPAPEAILAARQETGYQWVSVPDQTHIQKERPAIHLNLNAIAKGYAVDGVLALIRTTGVSNAYVEIGGEVAVVGLNEEETPWRTGIEWPDPEASAGSHLHGITHLTEGALATSGNYRRFYRDAGEGWIAHIIDPRTGQPVRHALASVSVWAPDCVTADTVATALFVMGREEGLQWIENQPLIEAFFFDADDSGEASPHFSSGFVERTGYQPLDDP